MQFIPRYLVDNKIDIVANEAGFLMEYRPVYTRQLQIYKGIDNILQFRVLNADQKPKHINTLTPKFVAFNEDDVLVIEHNGTVVDDGSTKSTKGIFTVTISENDLLNVKDQYLHYAIHLDDANGVSTLTYADSHFGNTGVMKISSEAYRGPYDSKEVLFNVGAVDGNYITSAIDAQPGINGNEALHTFAFYTNNFVGNIDIEATLDNQITNGTNWTAVDTVSFTGSETEPTPLSLNGVYTHLRFTTTTDPENKVTKILVRN